MDGDGCIMKLRGEEAAHASCRRKNIKRTIEGASASSFSYGGKNIMPRKPKRPCAYPGCPELVDGGYCEKHKKLVTEQYNKYGRDDFTKNFYKSPTWKIVRKRHLEQQPFCVECLKKGKTNKAVIVDHIVPIKDGGSRYDESNLQSLCWSCHSRKSVEEGSRFGRRPHEYENPYKG